MNTRTVVAIATAAVIGGGAVAWVLLSGRAERNVREGKIVWIDHETRIASLEFIHPNGRVSEISGEIVPDCDIRINGEPATIDDLRVGDEGRVRGRYHPDGRITAHVIRVERDESMDVNGASADAHEEQEDEARESGDDRAAGLESES